MAETPKMKKSKVSYYTTPKSKQLDDHLIEPLTPHISTPTPRRSLRLSAATPDPTPRRNAPPPLSPTTISITPASPQPTEYKRKMKLQEKRVSVDFEKKRESRSGKCSYAGDKLSKIFLAAMLIDKQSFLDSGILCCLIHVLNALLVPDGGSHLRKPNDNEHLLADNEYNDAEIRPVRQLEFTKEKYTEEDINEVRKEWAERVQSWLREK